MPLLLAVLLLSPPPAAGVSHAGAEAAAAPEAAPDPGDRPPRPEASQAERAARQILVTFPQPPTWHLPRAGTSRRAYGPDPRYRSSLRARRTAAKLAQDYGLREVADWPIDLLGVHCVVYEVPEEEAAGEVLERLAEDPRVESAQAMHVFRVLAAGYNDPYFELQVGARALQIEEAHRWALGRGVRVAVVDTGVDVEHPELAGRVTAAEDFVGDAARSFTTDVHGTAVAGIIASAANNGLGGVGVAPDAELLALKACWQEDPASQQAVCNSFTLAKALSFALDRRSQIVNLSLAGPTDPLLARLLRAAIAAGVVVVAAEEPGAGPHPAFPASVAGVVAVRAAERSGAAGAGPTLSLAAPGLDVLVPVPHGAFDFMSGNSFAAAHVSGIAALLLERDRRLTSAEVYSLLQRSSRGLAQDGGGGALVNACRALAELTAQGSCPPAEGETASTVSTKSRR